MSLAIQELQNILYTFIPIHLFIHANDPKTYVELSCVAISENLCVFSEGSFRLEFDMSVFANSLSVNFPGGKGVDCMAPRGPCLLFNDGIITARELNFFTKCSVGKTKAVNI